MKSNIKRICASTLALFYGAWFAPVAQAYSFDMIVPDVRQPAGISGGSACPVRTHRLTAAGELAVRLSNPVNTNPRKNVKPNPTARRGPAEIEPEGAQAPAVWAPATRSTHPPPTPPP